MRAYVIVAPLGILSTAVLRAFARAIDVLLVAVELASSLCQKTSGAVSVVFEPHAPRVPEGTSGFGTPEPQSRPRVLPMRTKSPFWFTW
jgi:hypothetical protein